MAGKKIISATRGRSPPSVLRSGAVSRKGPGSPETKRAKAEEAFEFSVLNSLPSHIAVLDRRGRIIAVNDAWLNFARLNDGEQMQRIAVGANYLEICRAAKGDRDAAEALGGLKAVLGGKLEKFSLAYACHSRIEQRWFLMTVTRGPKGVAAAVVCHTDITAQKRSEVALAESEARLRRLGDNLPGTAVYQYVRAGDTPGHFTYFSGGIEALTGVKVEEALRDPRALYGLILPEHYDELMREESRCIRELADFNVEVQMRRKDGEVRWMRIQSRPRRLPDGTLVWDGVQTDITAQREMAEALRRSEARWNAAIENLGEGAIIATETEQVVYWNPAARAMHGFTGEGEGIEPLSDTPKTFELWTPDGSHRLSLDEWPMRRLKRGETVRNLELRLRRPNQGWERIVAYSGSMVQTTGGERLIFLSVHDLTEQRRAERALRESEHRFRQVVESLPQLVWTCRAEGLCDYLSPQWVYYTGIPEAPQLGFGWLEQVHPGDRERTITLWQETAARGDLFSAEFRIRRHDGVYRWFHTLAVPLRDDAGSIVKWFGTNTDVTEARAAREVMARSNEELERIVAERTVKLQELVAELEHFSYTITHDMRAPLRAMRGFAEMVAETCKEPQQTQQYAMLSRIIAAAERMDLLISDALSYSRAVRQELPLAPVDAGALLRSMLDTYPELQPSKADIRLEGEFPPVLANEAGLTQCFSNLLGNAVKFVASGKRPEVRVWAELIPVPDLPEGFSPDVPLLPRGWIRIYFEDHGIGIPLQLLPRVFEMFSRGHASYEGTGIGLALVRKVVDRMGGRVGVESEEGNGSRFWVDLKPAP